MKKFFSIIFVLMFVLSTVACGGVSNSSTSDVTPVEGEEEGVGRSTDYIRIGSASVGGTAFIQMNAIAQLVNEKWDGVESTSQSTSGSSENIKLTLEGDLDAAQAQASVIEEAIEGIGSFENKPIDRDKLRCLATIQFNSIHLLTRKEAKIEKVEDLKGKRVGVGPVSGSHESAAKAFCENAGISYDDIKPIYGSVSELCESIKTGGLDALFYCTPHPSSTIDDVLNTGKVKLVGITKDIAQAVDSKSTSWGSYTIAAGSYSGQDEDIITIVTPTMFFVREDMDDDWVYKFTKLIYESNEFLIPFHANFKYTVPENINTGRILKMHPGAAKYFDEINIEIGEPK